MSAVILHIGRDELKEAGGCLLRRSLPAIMASKPAYLVPLATHSTEAVMYKYGDSPFLSHK